MTNKIIIIEVFGDCNYTILSNLTCGYLRLPQPHCFQWSPALIITAPAPGYWLFKTWSVYEILAIIDNWYKTEMIHKSVLV